MAAPTKPDYEPYIHNLGFDWDSYNTFRPPYPPSLYDLIFSYHHEKKQAQYDAAHDAGAGAGQCASVLATRFSTVYVSDPSADNVQAARRNLSSAAFVASLPRPCAIEVHAATAEEPWLNAASVDMFTMFACMHWAEPHAAVAQAAKTLRPGGTLAVVYYGTKPYIQGNDAADELWTQLLLENVREAAELSPLTRDRGIPQAKTGLDFVPLPAEHFEAGARRIRLNGGPGSKSFGEWRPGPTAKSEVGAFDSVEEASDVESWTAHVEPDWFRGYLVSLDSNFDQRRPGSEQDVLWGKLQEVLRKQPGKTVVTWPVAIILASKK